MSVEEVLASLTEDEMFVLLYTCWEHSAHEGTYFFLRSVKPRYHRAVESLRGKGVLRSADVPVPDPYYVYRTPLGERVLEDLGHMLAARSAARAR